MKRSTVIAAIIASAILQANSLSAQVLIGFGSEGQEYGKANCVDSENNHIVAALYQNTINIDPQGTSLLNSSGGVECAVVKYTPSGELMWGLSIGGQTSVDVPHGVETDGMNNVYVTGYIGSEADDEPRSAQFDPAGSALGRHTTMGGFDAFLAKYDADGGYQWSFTLGNTERATEERAWDIAVDAAGNSYIAGAFHGSINVDPLGVTSRVLSARGDQAALFVAKYGPDGANQWAMTCDAGLTNVFTEGYATVDLAPNGDLVLAGNFRNTVAFSGNEMTFTSRGETDVFLVRVDSQNGTITWGEQIGGTLTDIISPGAMRVDAEDQIYFTGRISGACGFGTDGATIVDGGSLYLAGYTGEGVLRFAFAMESVTPGSGGHRVGFDQDLNVYVVGWMRGIIDFDPSPVSVPLTSLGTQDIFLAKYRSDGSFVWGRRFGSSDNTRFDIAAGLAIDSDDNLYITGQYFGGSIDLDPTDEELLLVNQGLNDCFVAKYDTSGNLWREETTNINRTHIQRADIPHVRVEQERGQVCLTLTNRVHIEGTLYSVTGFPAGEIFAGEFEIGEHRVLLDTDLRANGIYYLRLSSENWVVAVPVTVLR